MAPWVWGEWSQLARRLRSLLPPGARPAKGERDVGAESHPDDPGRQLASCVAIPILLVDAEGKLIFYNEPAEDIMGQRFEETGEIPADEWNRLVTVADENRNPLPADERPMRAALLQRGPFRAGCGRGAGMGHGDRCR